MSPGPVQGTQHSPQPGPGATPLSPGWPYVIWRVFEHRRVDRQLRDAPREVLVRYEKWKDIVAMSGQPGLRLIEGFHDEALSRQWAGHRSSRLGIRWRVICRFEAAEIQVLAVAVTAHDYRRA